MDKASDYESGDSRFEFWWGRLFFSRGENKKIFAKESNLIFSKEKWVDLEVSKQYVICLCFFSSENLNRVIVFWICLPFLLVLSIPVNNQSRYLILQICKNRVMKWSLRKIEKCFA